jgi:hypothetical protein
MIDTQNKRRSVLAYTPGGFTLPVADALITGVDRAHVAWVYAGVGLIGDGVICTAAGGAFVLGLGAPGVAFVLGLNAPGKGNCCE